MASQDTYNMDITSEKRVDSSKSSAKRVTQPLRYRTRAFWLLGFYILLIVVPWVLTCVLAHRPINASSYVRQQGFSDHEVANMHKWKIAVDVLNSVAGLITIPVISAILAQAAVLFCQRRKPDEFLSLRDVFAIADRGWTNPSLIWNSILTWRTMPGAKSSARFLLPAACLIFLGAIQQPLYQILVRVSIVPVITCRDIPSWYTYGNCTGGQLYEEVGRDLEPAQMAIAEHSVMLSRVTSELASLSVDEPQSFLWSENTTYKPDVTAFKRLTGPGPRSLSHWVFQRSFIAGSDPVPDFFVAGVPAGTTTGVLRQHLMRLNSSVSCRKVEYSEFPSPCPGDRPLARSWEHVGSMNVRICVPGNYTAFPWETSRNRQDIIEEIYIDMKDRWFKEDEVEDSYPLPIDTSCSIHCTAATTRGYFELGNNLNNNTYGQLLDQWPDTVDMAARFNDWIDTGGWGQYSWDRVEPYVPSENDTSFIGHNPPPRYTDDLDPMSWKVPGPLTTSALALFGRGSWFKTAAGYVSKAIPTIYDDDNDPAKKIVPWQLFCRGMPFSRRQPWLEPSSIGATDFVSECDSVDQNILHGDREVMTSLETATQGLLAAFAPAESDTAMRNPENMLTTAMFVANQAFLTLFSPEFGPTYTRSAGRLIYTAPGTAVQKPLLSKRALIILSALIGLQLLGLSYLTFYLYRVPAWSDQLDAMAMARIGASLQQQGVLPAIGPVDKRDLKALQNVGGLIGIVEKGPHRKISFTRTVSSETTTANCPDVEMLRLNSAEEGRENPKMRSMSPDLAITSSLQVELQRLNSGEKGHESSEDDRPGAMSLNLATTRSTDAESQQLTSTEGLQGYSGEQSTCVELGLEAPGPILTTDVSRRSMYVLGMKRVWRALQSTKGP